MWQIKEWTWSFNVLSYEVLFYVSMLAAIMREKFSDKMLMELCWAILSNGWIVRGEDMVFIPFLTWHVGIDTRFRVQLLL